MRADISLLETDHERSDKLCKSLLDSIEGFKKRDPAEITFVSIDDLHKSIERTSKYNGSKLDTTFELLKNEQVLPETCVSFHNSGQIFLIPNETHAEKSILVFDEDALLSKVHGCL